MERLGYQMFADDISKLRRAFLQSMYECLETQILIEAQFAKER